jgi:hypothetical protein
MKTLKSLQGYVPDYTALFFFLIRFLKGGQLSGGGGIWERGGQEREHLA